MNVTHSGQTRSPWHTLAACFVCYAFDAVDFMLLALALPLVIREWGLSLTQAGLLGTAGMIGVAASGVAVGWYADNYGRRRALLFSVVIFAVFTAAVIVARDRYDLMALRLCAGLGLGGVWGTVTTLIREVWPRRTQARAIGFALSAWPVGVAIASALSAWLIPLLGWQRFFLIGLLSLLAALYAYWAVPESTAWQVQRSSRPPTRVSDIFAPALRRRTVLVTLAAACASTGYWGTNTWLPTYLVQVRHLTVPQSGWLLVVLNIGMFAGYQLLGLLGDRADPRRALLVCFGGATVMVPVYTLADSVSMLYWLGPLTALFFAYAGPFGAYVSRLYPTQLCGLGSGFCFSVGRGLASLAPFALGAIAGRIGLGNAIALSGLGYALAGLLIAVSPSPDQT